MKKKLIVRLVGWLLIIFGSSLILLHGALSLQIVQWTLLPSFIIFLCCSVNGIHLISSGKFPGNSVNLKEQRKLKLEKINAKLK
jgi:hypothetical protein